MHRVLLRLTSRILCYWQVLALALALVAALSLRPSSSESPSCQPVTPSPPSLLRPPTSYPRPAYLRPHSVVNPPVPVPDFPSPGYTGPNISQGRWKNPGSLQRQPPPSREVPVAQFQHIRGWPPGVQAFTFTIVRAAVLESSPTLRARMPAQRSALSRGKSPPARGAFTICLRSQFCSLKPVLRAWKFHITRKQRCGACGA